MRMFIRGLVGLAGVLALLLALQFWFDPEAPAARLGLSPQGGLGLATLRADLAGFFGLAGVMALAAAVRAQAALLTAPLVMIAIALTGRVITAATSGLAPDMVQPMVIEAVLLALFAAGRRFLA